MKILIFIKPVLDTRIAIECIDEDGRVKPEWNVSILNPDDAHAVAEALRIKNELSDVYITAVHLGPSVNERFLRDALALGCDAGVRIWDEGLENLHTSAKVEIFARVASIMGFDLIFTGTKSADTGSGQLGILVAESLGITCLTRVKRIEAIEEATVRTTRVLDRGYREVVEAEMPLLIAAEADQVPSVYGSLADVERATEMAIPCLDLAQIGISREAMRRAENLLSFGLLHPPAAGMKLGQTFDSSLPAFERRRILEKGTVIKGRGKIVTGEEDTVVEELFQTLLRHGWLKPLVRDSKKCE